MTTAVSSAPSLADLTAAKPKAKQTAAEESQDRFLKLLVAQLNNQDPMNPMDNAQTTTQMAQINTVSGIQNLNETVKNLANQFNSMQMLQGATMVGRNVLVPSNNLSVLEDGQAVGAIDLSGATDKVQIQIQTAGGYTLDTMDLGALPEGRHYFSWDASSHPNQKGLNFKVVSTAAGRDVEHASYAMDAVTSVGLENGAMKVQLSGRNPINYGDIKAIL
jgi:flagellar basal-body rod modification protein FlgD